MNAAGDLPTLISFFSGDAYYHRAAERLREDCERLEMPHDIVEVPMPEGADWSQVCRLKVPFYLEKLLEHDRPLLWVDVDCRLLRAPEALRGCRFDLAGFLRGFVHVREYDPHAAPRFWVPGVLFFNAGARSRRLLEEMVEIERTATQRVTDDWVLQEAWSRFDGQLDVGLLAPRQLVRTMDAATEETVFVYGDSGHVEDYRGSVAQHPASDPLSTPSMARKIQALHDSPQVRARTILDAAADLQRAKQRDAATELMRVTIARAPEDLATVRRYAGVLRSSGHLDEAYAALLPFLERDPEDGEARQALAQIALAGRDLPTARTHVDALLANRDARWRDFARSAAFDLDLEERAVERGLAAAERTPLWWRKRSWPGALEDASVPISSSG